MKSLLSLDMLHKLVAQAEIKVSAEVKEVKVAQRQEDVWRKASNVYYHNGYGVDTESTKLLVAYEQLICGGVKVTNTQISYLAELLGGEISKKGYKCLLKNLHRKGIYLEEVK